MGELGAGPALSRRGSHMPDVADPAVANCIAPGRFGVRDERLLLLASESFTGWALPQASV